MGNRGVGDRCVGTPGKLTQLASSCLALSALGACLLPDATRLDAAHIRAYLDQPTRAEEPGRDTE